MGKQYAGFTGAPDAVLLTKEMAAIRSYSFMDRQEEEISIYIEDFFKAHEIKTWRNEIVPGRYNTFALLPGEDPENYSSLMLSGHMDTVPAYDFEKAFDPWEDEEYIYGRGTVDMKGALACMMCALVNIRDSGVKLKGDLLFCAVADEEEAGIGTRSLIETGPECDYGIIGEPSCMEIALGHKGLEWIEITIKGKKVHGGAQNEGVNAIMMAGRFLTRLEPYIEELKTRTHPVLETATLNVGKIEGGDQPSTVPDIVKIRLDRRCITTETIEQVYRELTDILEGLHEEDPRFNYEIRDVFDGTTLPHIPFCIEKDSPLVKASESALIENGVEPIVSYFPAWTDAGFITAGTKTECIVMGPGELSVAHSVHERVAKQQLFLASDVYKKIALEICELEK